MDSSCKRQGQALPHVQSREEKDEKDVERIRDAAFNDWFLKKTVRCHILRSVILVSARDQKIVVLKWEDGGSVG